ncbi:MAG: replication factor C small subunit [Candidatus Aenigmarchaeota archaeon]|nr:replication factor C small subunit [Candidatus Aenigmarchaeota archaeon]
MQEIQEIWTEKYRPKLLKELVGHDDIVKRLENFIKNKSLPHCLFAGPAGIGKTTCALAIAREFFGSNWHSNFLELNASVTPDTPILIKQNGKIKRTNFAELDKEYFKNEETHTDRLPVSDLEILSIDNDYKICSKPVNYIFRHKKDKIAKLKFEGGIVKTSLDHSVMILNQDGELEDKKVSDLKEGDFLVTFKTEIGGETGNIDVKAFKPDLYVNLKSGRRLNPKIKTVLDSIELDDDISWSMGLYLAEGCLSHPKSDQFIYVLGYPKEKDMAKRVENIFLNLNLPVYKPMGRSGFDRNKESSIQIRILNTQMGRFFSNNFYGDSKIKRAPNKRVPDFIFRAAPKARISFIRGYHDGDGCGKWGHVARMSSRSRECLIDIAWLGRISGMETSCFEGESRIIWENPKFTYIKSELIPSFIAQNIIKKYNLPLTYLLRHSLYHKKSGRVSKKAMKSILEKIEIDDDFIKRMKKLVASDISVVEIKNIDIVDYDGYVYDVSVPDTQMFWGGTIPILLHNSDERGIETIRVKVKDFARTMPISGSFKIVYLDEADSLTKDAQHALRRTMENYSSSCRFILACNYSSKIIPPIQSRCAIFKFSTLKENIITKFLDRICKNEKLGCEEDALKAIVYVSGGDMRKAINMLQMTSFDGKLTKENIYAMAGKDPEEVKKMVLLALSRKFKESREILLKLLYERGMSGEDVIKEVHDQIFHIDIEDREKIHLLEKIGEIEFRITEGSNPRIQLESLLAQIALISGTKK